MKMLTLQHVNLSSEGTETHLALGISKQSVVLWLIILPNWVGALTQLVVEFDRSIQARSKPFPNDGFWSIMQEISVFDEDGYLFVVFWCTKTGFSYTICSLSYSNDEP